jgi:acyl-CoA thioester hydrolase
VQAENARQSPDFQTMLRAMESENLKNFRAGFRSFTELRVAWGDMDAMNHVNNAVYFGYLESGRIVHLTALGAYAENRKTGTVVGSIQCRFRIPLTYPDTIIVGSRVADLGEDRFTFEYAIYSHRHDRIAAEASSVVVAISLHDGRKTSLSANVCAAIAAEKENTR